MFDIGVTVSTALRRYLTDKNPFSGSTDPRSSGNGSIMRLAPIPIFYHKELNACVHYAGESSKTTHASELCIESCRLFSYLIHKAFSANNKDEIFENIPFRTCDELRSIMDSSFKDLGYIQLTGSGFVIESLISALWCFYHGKNFKDAILLSANIGNDADTTAAICGQIAGAYYGYSNIPVVWRESITMADEIKALALDLYSIGNDLQ